MKSREQSRARPTVLPPSRPSGGPLTPATSQYYPSGRLGGRKGTGGEGGTPSRRPPSLSRGLPLPDGRHLTAETVPPATPAGNSGTQRPAAVNGERTSTSSPGDSLLFDQTCWSPGARLRDAAKTASRCPPGSLPVVTCPLQFQAREHGKRGSTLPASRGRCPELSRARLRRRPPKAEFTGEGP